jgi:hypothetical protein
MHDTFALEQLEHSGLALSHCLSVSTQCCRCAQGWDHLLPPTLASLASYQDSRPFVWTPLGCSCTSIFRAFLHFDFAVQKRLKQQFICPEHIKSTCMYCFRTIPTRGCPYQRRFSNRGVWRERGWRCRG